MLRHGKARGGVSEIPDIDPGDDGGEIGEVAPPTDGASVEAAALASDIHCLSCGGALVGPFCPWCGQKDDDMRRSLFMLARNFIEDTFSFDSRMWKTLGMMAVAPGLVPALYTHGKRSQFTPPVRLFLVVSFLFFLVLGVTQTMFVAVEVTAKSPEQIVADKAESDAAIASLPADVRAIVDDAEDNQLIAVDGETVNCNIDVGLRFFVRPQDVKFDEESWRECSESVARSANVELSGGVNSKLDVNGEKTLTEEDVRQGFDRVMAGLNKMVSDPLAFNSEINAWLPRVMFFMTPILALLMSLFIRGKDALMFDHLVLSFYSHATAFAVIGAAIILGQFGVPQMLPAAVLALFVYYTAAQRRAYRRGWVKTVYSSAFIGFLYMVLLSSIVVAIISNRVWTAAA
jgi:hypothetical protein